MKKATALMNEKIHNHVSMMTDPVDDADLVLNLSRLHSSPCKSTISNYVNLSIANDDKITLGNISSARLKSLGRIIGSESERELCAHVLMTITHEFRALKLARKLNDLSSGALAAEKLVKRMF